MAITPRDTPGLEFSQIMSEDGLQVIGQANSSGLIQAEFVHTSPCEGGEVELVSAEAGISVEIELGGYKVAYSIRPPWAVDANGAELPTWYEVDGTNLRQVIDATGAQAPITFDPEYKTFICERFSAEEYGSTYLDFSQDDSVICPVRGMFYATNAYLPELAFETNVANDYGWVVVRRDGGCSTSPDTGPYWDFQVPCKAHDFCYDMRKAGFSGTVSDGACDSLFHSLMDAHCDDRVLAGDCYVVSDIYYAAVSAPGVVTNPDPEPVRFELVGGTGSAPNRCPEVEGASTAVGAYYQLGDCAGGDNHWFRVLPAPEDPGRFVLQAVHSDKCAAVESTGQSNVRQANCSDIPINNQHFAVRETSTTNRYTIRGAIEPGLAGCLLSFGDAIGTRLLHTACDPSNPWFQWYVRSS